MVGMEMGRAGQGRAGRQIDRQAGRHTPPYTDGQTENIVRYGLGMRGM